MLELGDKVVVTARYERKDSAVNGFPWRVWFRHTHSPRRGIVVGIRQISNGEMAFGDDGFTYTPRIYGKAALVVFNLRENPVRVPLDAVELVGIKKRVKAWQIEREIGAMV